MSILRLASKETKRITLEGDDYIEVKTDVSKRDFNQLLKILPSDFSGDAGLSPTAAEDFTSFLFQLLVVGWSLQDDSGNPVIPTLETYFSLTREAALAVDAAIVEHFNSLTPSDGERRKSEGPSL